MKHQLPSRRASVLFAAAAATVLAPSVSSQVEAAPRNNLNGVVYVTGRYNNQPGVGAVLNARLAPYIIQPAAQFNNNGQSPAEQAKNIGSGAYANGAKVIVNGGSFVSNYAFGLEADNKANIVIQGGSFRENFGGVYLNGQSQAIVNGGDFSHNFIFGGVNTVGLVFDNGSGGAINGGTFNFNHLGMRMKDSAPVTVTGGDFSHNLGNGIQTVHGPLVVTGANARANYAAGVFVCGTTGRIDGGTFTQNGVGAWATRSYTDTPAGPVLVPGNLTINRGNFFRNIAGGLYVWGESSNPTEVVINNGNFSDNGVPDIPTVMGMFGGVAVEGSSKVNIKGGTFTNNYPCSVSTKDAGSALTIDGGTFSAREAGLACVRVGNGGQGGTATINGGTFTGGTSSVWVATGSRATINGGTFTGGSPDLFADIDSEVTVNGGTFKNTMMNISVFFAGTVHLYGTFDGYNTRRGPVTLTNTSTIPIIGTLSGRLQNNKTSQLLRYRIRRYGRIVLHSPTK